VEAPVSASDVGVRVDHLFYALLALTGFVAAVIFALILYFCVRYRAGSPADRANPPTSKRPLEYGWIFAPLALFIGIYAWGATVYAEFYRRGPGEMTVFVVGKQWMWRAEHANGRREIDELHLPLGQPVRLVLSTQDVIHSFYVPAFRVKQDAVPGRYTTIRFTPTQAGEYRLNCAEYCGTEHSRMGGKVVVMAPAEFSLWLSAGNETASLSAKGFDLFRKKGCSGCHDARSTVHAPDLAGAYGRIVPLEDGRKVYADEAYLRDSILLPKKDVVAGFAPVMPSFRGQLDEDELAALVGYLKSLSSSGN
jgi:cytochrome c oxidase subunit 2